MFKEIASKPGKLILIVGILSMLMAVISRITLIPVPPMDLEAEALLNFAGVCFLLSIALSLIDAKK